MAKVTLIGAGSILWSPKVLGDFYIAQQKAVDEICLMDINEQSLEPIIALTKLMEAKTGRKFKISKETDFERSLKDADYIVIAIAVGGLKAMQRDIEISEKYGIFATVGDTVGPAGHSRLFRNVKVFDDMASKIARISPQAWVINISNPLTGITRLVSQQTSLKTVGLCAGIVNHIWILKDLLEIENPAQLDYRVAGIDHCSWFIELKACGQDLYQKLRSMSVSELDEKASLLNSKDEWANLDSLTAGFTLFKHLNYLPAISDRHVGEFFPYFVTSSANLAKYNMKRTSIADRVGWGENAKRRINAILNGQEELKLTKTRDIVVDVINALAGSGAIVTTINHPNIGQISNLPMGSVVETLGCVDKNLITPLEAGPLPQQIHQIVLPHLLRQELVVKAGLENSPAMFKAAVMSDPNITNLENISTMTEELIAFAE